MYQMVIGKCLMVFGIIMLIKGNESFVIRSNINFISFMLQSGHFHNRIKIEKNANYIE